MQLLRLPEVRNKIGRSRSAIYQDINRKLLTPPIKNGLRSSAWPAHEIDAVIEARIAGRSEAEIRALVDCLVKARKGISGGES